MTTEEELLYHAETIAGRVKRNGGCVFWSEVLGEKVAFICASVFLRHVPEGVVVYRDQELRELFGNDKPSISPSALRLVHETKKMGGEVSGCGKQGELI